MASLGHPSKFQRVKRLGFVTAATSLNGGQPNFARCLAVSWTGTLYIHFLGLLPRNGILPCAKFTLRPTLAFSYIGSVTARHSSTGRQRQFAASYKEWNYGTFADGATYIRLGGHPAGHRPTVQLCVFHWVLGCLSALQGRPKSQNSTRDFKVLVLALACPCCLGPVNRTGSTYEIRDPAATSLRHDTLNADLQLRRRQQLHDVIVERDT